MKILFACKEFPHEKIIGGPIIIFNRIKHLSRRHTVSLIAFATEEHKRYVDTVKPFCHDLRLIPLPPKRSLLKAAWDFFFSEIPHYFLRVHGSEEMRRTLADMVKQDQYDFVIAEYSVMGQFLYRNPLLPLPVKKIMSVHECYYLARLKDYLHHGIGRKKVREAINLKGLKKYEFDMYGSADKVLILTPQGKQELLDICPDLDIEVVPHGVDTEKFGFSDPESDEKSIVFVGNYLHYPNTDAVMYFHREIWPSVKQRIPGIKFYVVGQSPPPEIEKMAQEEGVIVTGRVDEVAPYLRKALVFICPVRLGGGFRGKILEAMAVGRPIVSTPLGAEGIPAADRENIMLAQNAEEFADSVCELVTDRSLYDAVRNNARQLVEDRYSWEKGVDILEKVLEKIQEEGA